MKRILAKDLAGEMLLRGHKPEDCREMGGAAVERFGPDAELEVWHSSEVVNEMYAMLSRTGVDRGMSLVTERRRVITDWPDLLEAKA